MSHLKQVVSIKAKAKVKEVCIKVEEKVNGLQRSVVSRNSNTMRPSKLRNVINRRSPSVKPESLSDEGESELLKDDTSADGPLKRKRDPEEDEPEEERPSKRRVSEGESSRSQDEDEEEVQRLVKCGQTEEGKMLPAISLALWRANAVQAATVVNRERAPSPPEALSTGRGGGFLPPSPPWSHEADQAETTSVLVGTRCLRLTESRLKRLGRATRRVPAVPRSAIAAGNQPPACKRKQAKGKKKAATRS